MHCNILEYLEEAEASHPQKAAFGDTSGEATYQAFGPMARQIGSRQAALGAYGEPVAILMEKDVKNLAAFFGAVYSGCFYVPIDKTLPKGRIRTILSVVKPRFVILGKGDAALAEGLLAEATALFLEDLLSPAPICEERLRQIRESHLDTNPLYMMFTSGSTGVPKGVLVSHKSVIDMAEQFTRTFHFTGEDVFANQAPFDFDVSVKDIYLTLRNGATMQIVPKGMFVLPKNLARYLNEKKATTLIWAASALSVVSTLDAFKEEAPASLRRVMFSGEVLPIRVLHYWQKHLGNAQYVNLYGPTEITCNCTYYIVDREFAPGEILPIGKPFPNTEILLLDSEDKPAGVGEICVRGSCLALGYYHNLEATQKAFCQNPLQGGYPELIYRTGDMGFYNERGELVFQSRKDYQIKRMGHRIELFEIEAAVNAVDGVDRCCCIYDQDKEKIILFYQAKEALEADILRYLQQNLPKYMFPNLFQHMERLPENSHGKIDRRRLEQEYREQKQ